MAEFTGSFGWFFVEGFLLVVGVISGLTGFGALCASMDENEPVYERRFSAVGWVICWLVALAAFSAMYALRNGWPR